MAPGAPPPAPGPPGAPGADAAAPAPGEGASAETALVAAQEDMFNLEPALSNIQPIPIKKTLMIVNNFIINTTEFMNKFAVLCERKLSKVSQKTTNLEIMLALLEVKLGSIEWLSGGGAVAGSEAGGGAGDGGVSAPPPPPGPGSPPPPPPGAPGAAGPPPPAPPAPPAGAAGGAAAPVETYQGPCLKDDPRYAKFIKMQAMGVPIQALTIKMQAEGVDPSVLDMDPMGPPPYSSGGGVTAVVVSHHDNDSSEEESDIDAD